MLLTAIPVFCLISCEQERHSSLIIGFYNLENLFDTINQPYVIDEEFTPQGVKRYTGEVYYDKLTKLSRVISEMEMDKSRNRLVLLGVAEVENKDVLMDLVKEPLLSGKYLVAHLDGKDERGIEVGLLYSPDYFTLSGMQSFHVATENIDSAYGRTRDIFYVNGKLLGETIHVFVNHWPSRRIGVEASQPYRQLAASVCRQKLDSLLKIEPDAKIIVMGDFNDNPSDASVSMVLGAKNEVEQVKRGDLYNPWSDIHQTGTGTYLFQGSWNLLDQIMLSSSFLEPDSTGYFFKEAIIFKPEYLIQKEGKYAGHPYKSYFGNFYSGGYSDHFPVCVILKTGK